MCTRTHRNHPKQHKSCTTISTLCNMRVWHQMIREEGTIEAPICIHAPRQTDAPHVLPVTGRHKTPPPESGRGSPVRVRQRSVKAAYLLHVDDLGALVGVEEEEVLVRGEGPQVGGHIGLHLV